MDNIRVGVGAVVWHRRGTHVLLARRGPKAKNERGKWEFPGGAMDMYETPIDAAIREVKEELNVDCDRGMDSVCRAVDIPLKNENQHWVSWVVHLRAASDAFTIMEPEKCSEVIWIRPNLIHEFAQRSGGLSKAAELSLDIIGVKQTALLDCHSRHLPKDVKAYRVNLLAEAEAENADSLYFSATMPGSELDAKALGIPAAPNIFREIVLALPTINGMDGRRNLIDHVSVWSACDGYGVNVSACEFHDQADVEDCELVITLVEHDDIIMGRAFSSKVSRDAGVFESGAPWWIN